MNCLNYKLVDSCSANIHNISFSLKEDIKEKAAERKINHYKKLAKKATTLEGYKKILADILQVIQGFTDKPVYNEFMAEYKKLEKEYLDKADSYKTRKMRYKEAEAEVDQNRLDKDVEAHKTDYENATKSIEESRRKTDKNNIEQNLLKEKNEAYKNELNSKNKLKNAVTANAEISPFLYKLGKLPLVGNLARNEYNNRVYAAREILKDNNMDPSTVKDWEQITAERDHKNAVRGAEVQENVGKVVHAVGKGITNTAKNIEKRFYQAGNTRKAVFNTDKGANDTITTKESNTSNNDSKVNNNDENHKNNNDEVVRGKTNKSKKKSNFHGSPGKVRVNKSHSNNYYERNANKKSNTPEPKQIDSEDSKKKDKSKSKTGYEGKENINKYTGTRDNIHTMSDHSEFSYVGKLLSFDDSNKSDDKDSSKKSESKTESKDSDNKNNNKSNESNRSLIGGGTLVKLALAGGVIYLSKKVYDGLKASAYEEGMSIAEYLKYKYGGIPKKLGVNIVDKAKPSNPLLNPY